VQRNLIIARIAVGVLWPWMVKIPLFRLLADIVVSKPHLGVYLPSRAWWCSASPSRFFSGSSGSSRSSGWPMTGRPLLSPLGREASSQRTRGVAVKPGQGDRVYGIAGDEVIEVKRGKP